MGIKLVLPCVTEEPTEFHRVIDRITPFSVEIGDRERNRCNLCVSVLNGEGMFEIWINPISGRMEGLTLISIDRPIVQRNIEYSPCAEGKMIEGYPTFCTVPWGTTPTSELALEKSDYFIRYEVPFSCELFNNCLRLGISDKKPVALVNFRDLLQVELGEGRELAGFILPNLSVEEKNILAYEVFPDKFTLQN